MRKLISSLFLSSFFILFNTESFAHENPKINSFIIDLALNSTYTQKELEILFNNFKHNQRLIDLMNKPFEGKSWDEYDAYLVSEKRIKLGANFWRENKKSLKKAEKEYGVPSEIITAIIGIETFYGRNTGRVSVLEALSTFAFNYPKRERFFSKELREFLLMCKEENLDPKKPLGSYAGAMGRTQFMPSSFRHYAIDFNHCGKRDIFNNNDDSIGSVANYMNKNGWDRKQHDFLKPIAKPKDKIKNMVEFDTKNSDQKYWLGLHNFYVITRYNTSKNYARAVVHLSQEIKKEVEKTNG